MKSTIFLIVICFLAFSSIAQEQETITRKEVREKVLAEQKEILKHHVENRSFVFDARTAISATGTNYNVDYPYNVRLANDSVYSYLPYYGRAYQAEFSSTRSPMMFNVPVKEIEITKNKKKGYQVDIKVEDGSDNVLFNFSISETGSATLTVTSLNRQNITYYGEILVERETDENNL